MKFHGGKCHDDEKEMPSYSFDSEAWGQHNI